MNAASALNLHPAAEQKPNPRSELHTRSPSSYWSPWCSCAGGPQERDLATPRFPRGDHPKARVKLGEGGLFLYSNDRLFRTKAKNGVRCRGN